MKKKISFSQAQEYFNSIIGLPIWEVAYVADSIFFFKIGKKMDSTILSKDMKSQESYVDGEYVLHLDGNWKFFDEDREIFSSDQSSTETNRKYYDKMYELERLLKENASRVIKIRVSQHGAKIEFNNKRYFLLKPSEFGMLSVSLFKDSLIYYDNTSKSFVKEKCGG